MKTFVGSLALMVLLGAPIAALAADYRVGQQPTLPSSQTITGNEYLAGGTVTSAGAVSGDVVAAGGNLGISGAVGGDVLAAGGNVTISSSVGGDVRFAGGNISVQGKVNGDVIAAGGSVALSGPGVGGDAALAGGSVDISAPVSGSVRVGGGKVYIDGPITGDVIINAVTLTLGSNADIQGSLTYTATKELTKESGAQVRGEVHFTQRAPRSEEAAIAATVFSVWVFGKFLALLVCALVAGLVFARFSREIVERVVREPLTHFGVGLLTLAALPVISVLLFATLVGIPLGVLGLLSFAVVMLVSWLFTPIVVGSVVYHFFSKRDWVNSWFTILIGAFVYSILGLIPFVGWLLQLILLLLSLGAIVSVLWVGLRGWRS